MRVAVVHNSDVSGVINVFGPQNREKYNPKTVALVAAALETGGHNVRVLEGNMHLIDELTEFMPRVIAGERPGMVFNMAYGIQGVSRYTHLPAMLEMLGVPYVGSGPQAHGLALDKVVAKMLFEANGLPTPGYWNFSSPDDHFDDLRFPAIVKPKMEAVSFGIQVVSNEDELRDAVRRLIDEFKQHVLVEQFIAGREVAIGLLGNGDPEVLPIVEIDLEGDPDAIQTADDKLAQPRDKICPAPLDDDERERLEALAKRAFATLELYDFARVDLRLDRAGDPYILEINSMASLGLTGTYVHAAKAAGYSYEALINKMLDVAAVRYFGDEHLAERTDGTSARRPPFTARIRSYLRSNATTIEDSLREIVDHRSPVENAELVNGLGDWLSNRLRDLGFNREVFANVDAGNALYFTNQAGPEIDVLLVGHLDTATGRFRRFRAEGRRLYGSGIAEHKGGLAILLAALRALRFTRTLRSVRVGVLVTTDDTVDGLHGAPLVERLARQSKVVYGLKAGDLDGGVVTSRSGRATYRIDAVFGDSRKPLTPGRAISAICQRANQVNALDDPERGVRTAITRLEVHGSFDELPDDARLAVSVRFNEPSEGPELDRRLRELFAKAPSGMRFQVRGGIRRPPMSSSEASAAIVERLRALADELHIPLTQTHRWHSSDLCAVPEGTAVVDGMGPIGKGERTSDEYVLRSSLVDRAALLALAIRDAAKL